MSDAKKHLWELDLFNAIACLAVILIHVLSLGITALDRTSWQFSVIYFPWKLSAFVVPAFLFSGAVKMAAAMEQDRPSSYPSYILRRFCKIFLPYVIFYVVYYIALALIGYLEPSTDGFVKQLFLGNLSSHFYYVIIVMQFYLLYPVWRAVISHIKWYVGLPISAMISLAMLKMPSLLSLFGIDFLYTDRIFPTYIFFWALGLYVGKHYGILREVLKKSTRYIIPASLFVILFVSVTYYQTRSGRYFINADYFKLISDTLSIFILLTLCILIADSDLSRIKKLLCGIYRSSYSVYLSHCLFLTLATHFMQLYGIGSTAVLLLIRAIVCYTLPFALYVITSKIRGIVR